MTLLQDRYQILAEIGRGSQATTYRAKDLQSGEDVAIKELDFKRVEDWKSQELFEREGRTLQGLDHPSIPKFIDAFAIEEDATIRLFLVQQFMEGETFAEELSRRQWTEGELIDDAIQILEALVYLHSQSPPVIHRDLKPSNMIRCLDGRIVLVDFGAVQNTIPTTVGGSTVIGTPGYMPIEQLMGRATAASDLYALGATLIHLMSGTSPSSLPVERNRIVFADRINASPRLKAALTTLTEPTAEDRPPDAAYALRAFQSLKIPPVLESTSLIAVDGLPSRSLTFPGWAVVTPIKQGEFEFEFQTYDIHERPLKVCVLDAVETLEIDVWANVKKRHEKTKTGIYSLIFFSGLTLFFFWILFPVLIPVVFAFIVAVFVVETLRRSDKPDIRVVITPTSTLLEFEGQPTLELNTEMVRWRLVDESTLELVTESGHRLDALSFSATAPEKALWLYELVSRARPRN